MSDAPPPGQSVGLRLDVSVPMRDGVRLSTDLYQPPGEGPFPTLLVRTYYDNQNAFYVERAVQFARAGYAVALQDTRGRYDSEGTWRPYQDEMNDGHDTIEWLGRQPWCDGRVGTFGHSYNGFTASRPAALHSPYLQAVVSQAGQEDNFFGHCYCEGALEFWNVLNFASLGRRTLQFASRKFIDFDALARRLPLITALDDLVDQPSYRDFLRHPTFDEFWQCYSLKGKYGAIEAPALIITGWYDNLSREGFKLFRGWSQGAGTPAARSRSKLLVGPWAHDSLGSAARYADLDFGPVAAVDLAAWHLRWFDQRLRGIDTGLDEEAPVRLFVMGANVWRSEAAWPLPRTRFTPWYLHGGAANGLAGDGTLAPAPPGDEPADQFTYDPQDPVPTLGGQIQPLAVAGPRDRRSVEQRGDVLVYTSAPLREDLEVTGPVALVLYAASTAPDTDFTAALVDVHPDGPAIILCEGIVRARYRQSREQPTPLEPGVVYEFRLDLWQTSNVFRTGHCLRLEVASSNFPRFDRNLNTGHPIGMDAEWQTARQTIYHDARYPSHVLLPVIPGGA